MVKGDLKETQYGFRRQNRTGCNVSTVLGGLDG